MRALVIKIPDWGTRRCEESGRISQIEKREKIRMEQINIYKGALNRQDETSRRGDSETMKESHVGTKMSLHCT